MNVVDLNVHRLSIELGLTYPTLYTILLEYGVSKMETKADIQTILSKCRNLANDNTNINAQA